MDQADMSITNDEIIDAIEGYSPPIKGKPTQV